MASIVIGLVLAVVAFVLARSSRGLLLGEAANPKVLQAIKKAIESHPNVERVVELLTMHLAPKQILINAHVKLRPNLVTNDVVSSIEEVEKRIRQAEPKVEMIFLEVARDDQRDQHVQVAEHIG
jgi:divalent metal cation (Fe/Co/Zn/Cd) transporter